MSARLPISSSPPRAIALPQVASHFPAVPPPVDVMLTVLPPQPCPYFADRVARIRAIHATRIEPEMYHDFMDAGFRRSGRMLYQPVCAGCRDCVQIRVPVASFAMSKSQRRTWRRNADLLVRITRPRPTQEKYDLYRLYLRDRHDGQQEDSRGAFEAFLYESPARSVEFEYRLPTGRLVAAGICDLCSRSLSSVYFYFDPDESRRRGLGNYGALREIAFAREQGVPHYYLGYWVRHSPTMDYKSTFRPNEILCGDGQWRTAADHTG